ncbi:hypothetical protein [Streptomyces sp. MST-110588]|uniref:class I SAM-dependent methyltransferase n=1 Tax=Streptomyces sp. MST-110588 TaxID=2833628 RepID=UPI001F5E2CA1|nr:hypothetical protein [Streptomyces sp. MST-110588]
MSDSRCFDDAVRAYVRRHPRATVVALGEGLDTAFWRVDNGRLTWLTVESPKAAAVRRMLLPDGPRRYTVACPATDPAWLDAVPAPERGVIVTARGLLLAPGQVRALLAACAQRLPGGALVLGTVPRRLAALARRPGARPRETPEVWEAPETPKGWSRAGMAGACPGVVEVRALRTPPRAVTEIRFGPRPP